MVSFIHIADKNDEQAILRNGIRSKRLRDRKHQRPIRRLEWSQQLP